MPDTDPSYILSTIFLKNLNLLFFLLKIQQGTPQKSDKKKVPAPPFQHDPNIIEMNLGLKPRKITGTKLYRVTDKGKAKQTILKVGYPEYSTKNGMFIGLYPQLIFQQMYTHEGRSRNPDGSEKKPYGKNFFKNLNWSSK